MYKTKNRKLQKETTQRHCRKLQNINNNETFTTKFMVNALGTCVYTTIIVSKRHVMLRKKWNRFLS